ncbi:hypothetical protein DR64_7871 [Paraburkholderia xenovorans LB400]|nr:hypothetical protein DR64_7871 [Paraburkholderia xenovorans LB400]
MTVYQTSCRRGCRDSASPYLPAVDAVCLPNRFSIGALSVENYSSWIGRNETRQDVATLQPALALGATLDRATIFLNGRSELPPLSHWLYFLSTAPMSRLGTDGHPRRGDFLPPISLPRRMWAGSRIDFLVPIVIGAPIERTSTIVRVNEKRGRSGTLCFVTLLHEVKVDSILAVREEQDIVYREASPLGDPLTKGVAVTESAALASPDWTRTVMPDPVLLFRYSALTFNGHRIHYDRDYATKEEGYPGLVVHGPLQATLLLDLISRSRPAATVRKFSFRAKNPLFDGKPLELCASLSGHMVKLWTVQSAHVGIEADAELE